MSEEEKIERAFQIRLNRLREWKESELNKAKSRRDLNFTEVCSSQGNIVGGGLSCTPISLVAVYNFLRKPKRDICKMNWQRIVENGVELYSEWAVTNKSIGVYFPFSEEVFNIETLSRLHEKILVLKTLGGNLNDETTKKCGSHEMGSEYAKSLCEGPINGWKYDKSYYTLTEILFFLTDEKSAATFTIRQTTVSLFYCNNRYWMFDSHGKKSKLWECVNRIQLEMLIRSKFPLFKQFITIGNKRVKIHDEADNTFDFVLFAKK